MIPVDVSTLERFLADARRDLAAAIEAEHQALAAFEAARDVWLKRRPTAAFSAEYRDYNLAIDALSRAREALARARRWEAECEVDLATEQRRGAGGVR